MALLILDILVLGAALACAKDLLRSVDQDAHGGQQILLLLPGGLRLEPRNDAQGDPTGEQADLCLQDGGEINGIHVDHAPFFNSYSVFSAERVRGPTMPSTSNA